MQINKMGLKQVVKLCLVVASIAVLAGCQSQSPNAANSPATSENTATDAAATDKQSLKTVKFTLSWLLQGVDAPLTVAIDKGYFAKEGVDVKFERGYGSADSVSKIAAGQYDMGLGDMYSMIEFNEKNPDQKLVAIAVPFNKAPFAIATLKKSGIGSPKDLEGKKLGAPAGDAPRRLFPVFAKQVGISTDSAKWTSMEPKLRESFLLQGQVDAISGFSYSMLPSLLKGGAKPEDIEVFYYTDNGLDFYGNAIIAKESFVKENPELIKSFLKAFFLGFQDTLKDPAAGLDSVMAAGDKLMNKDAEKLRLQIALEKLFVNPEVEKVGLGDVDPERLRKTIEQTVIGFGLKNTPQLEEVFDGSLLPPKEERAVPPKAELKPLT
jgi:NitT/TauT family transport system substrate-binding protein